MCFLERYAVSFYIYDKQKWLKEILWLHWVHKIINEKEKSFKMVIAHWIAFHESLYDRSRNIAIVYNTTQWFN